MAKVKKDEGYYKKLFKRLKKQFSGYSNNLLKDLDVYQTIFTVLVKRSKNQTLKITFKELQDLKPTDKVTREIDKDKNLIFKMRKVEEDAK